jgi:hypothetical protein
VTFRGPSQDVSLQIVLKVTVFLMFPGFLIDLLLLCLLVAMGAFNVLFNGLRLVGLILLQSLLKN